MNSVEDFQEKLSRELAWRKQEIVGLRLSARRSLSERVYLYRAGLVLLCAHWEGFLRRAVSLYFDHVFAQRLPIKELKSNFVAAAFFSDVQRAGKAEYPGSVDAHQRLIEKLVKGGDEICTKSTWEIRTEGNPGTEVMGRFLRSAGLNSHLSLDAASWAAMKVFIDEQIVRDRHLIAHGEGRRLTREEFLQRSSRMLDLLELLNRELVTAAEHAWYRVFPHQSTAER